MAVERKVGAVIVAAGSSRRMGQPKLLLPWGETTVIGQVARVVCGAGLAETVLVTGRAPEQVRAAASGCALRWAHNPDFEHAEMLQSLQIGLRELSPTLAACLIVLGDQPQLEARVLQEMLQVDLETPHPILIPSYQHRRGHPWLLQRELWAELLDLPAEASLRVLLNRHADEIHYLNVNTPSVLMDLDTPEDYARSRPAGSPEAGLP